MVKATRLLAIVKQRKRNVRFREMQQLLLQFGFQKRQSKKGSSHYVFSHPRLVQNVVLVTHGKDDLLPEYQVKDALDALSELEEIE